MTPELRDVIARAYCVFGGYRLRGTVTVCTCPVCVSEEGARRLVTTPLREISTSLLGEYTNSAHGLIEDELRYFLPRYFELLADGEVPSSNGVELCLARMYDANYRVNWPSAEGEAIDAFFSAMFRQWLKAPARCYMGRSVLLNGPDAEELLCMVARAGGTVVPLLRLWDETTGRPADLRIASLINNARIAEVTLGSAHWDTGDHPDLEPQLRDVFDWLEDTDRFERVDTALGREQEPLARKFLETAIDRWITLSKRAVS